MPAGKQSSENRPPADDLTGDMEVLGLLPGSSNYTFLAQIAAAPQTLVVYKPRKGETPLWDFPGGTLCQREAAAFEVCRAAGFEHVPPTIIRDGPLGEGAVQLFIDHDPSITAFDLADGHTAQLRMIAVFDVVANNADRKAGHVLQGRSGGIWGIDHGLCFHHEPKLRTVLWDYVGEELSDGELLRVRALDEALRGPLGRTLKGLLSAEELQALVVRTQRLLTNPVFPEPGPGRPIPWPPI